MRAALWCAIAVAWVATLATIAGIRSLDGVDPRRLAEDSAAARGQYAGLSRHAVDSMSHLHAYFPSAR